MAAAGAFEAMNQLAPHIYLVAGAAFRDMVRQGTSQSLVINGESGAGKTETTKKAMQFFAALAGGTGVEDQVLEVREGAWEQQSWKSTLCQKHSNRSMRHWQWSVNKQHWSQW